jgi:hypothetical protein
MFLLFLFVKNNLSDKKLLAANLILVVIKNSFDMVLQNVISPISYKEIKTILKPGVLSLKV